MYSEQDAAAKTGPPAWDPRLTEARNPRTGDIDRADAGAIVALMQAEDRAVPAAVRSQAAAIARAIDEVAERLRAGGRLVYVGAGTSGRLGVLDAAECPPTFGTEPEQVRGLIAGGEAALVRSSEGAEDDPAAGAEAVSGIAVGAGDFVLGIATSGTTPYVRGALEEARRRGARIAFLSCTEPPPVIRALEPLLITPLVGPEVIAGSTRLKAGTATKLVLNTLTTGAMIRSGRVYRNLMVDLRARSAKLVDRGIRIVSHVCGLDRDAARGLLVEAGGSVKVALGMHLLGVPRDVAERRLDAVDGFLRDAVDRHARAPDAEWEAFPEMPGRPDGGELLARLAAAAGQLSAARAAAIAGDAEGGLVPARTGGWTPSGHVAHLLQFETECVGERVRRWVAEPSPRFDSWEPSATPTAADRPFAELVESFDRARHRTLAPLGSTVDWGRRARIGHERPTLYQFLRGVAQHDGAHATRISERVHPALLRPLAGAPGGTA